ncbi:hypothetical protein [Nitrosospira multiformis]|nr:hypothetical protein [Nitrosospira multiformis]
MAWQRHPLAFLVEAADDICYHVMDVEDGFKAGFLAYEELHLLHKPWLTAEQSRKAEEIKDVQRRAEYFRAVTVSTMVVASYAAFPIVQNTRAHGTRVALPARSLIF